ncbi:GCN5 family acetyltransferase [Virgibacillus soli]|uniref:GCN5 family acetyltransferase n=1 Tax=Lederbergia galactosidilytica TaxID=217031 RepID=A0A0Q9YI91_9BACI|nr:GCN5 family acetyltransferase [Virgibacillus soli]KRG16750.1 GCN5 family acetyltransferase [Lederbergia galactosidilytica]
MNNFVISKDKSLLELDTIYSWLQHSYWASKRSKNKIKKSIENSVCYGVYDGGKQIGFARVITDWTVMYWLCDVIIDEKYRGQGIGKKLIEEVIHDDDFKDLFGYLGTKDAHTFYEAFGFVQEQEKVMIRTPDYLRNE